MSAKISFNLRFVRNGEEEDYAFDCSYEESRGMTEFYNDLITSILKNYDFGFITDIKVKKNKNKIIRF